MKLVKYPILKQMHIFKMSVQFQVLEILTGQLFISDQSDF
jgi:hypothetical protein